MSNAPDFPEKLYKYRTFDKEGYYMRLLKYNDLFFSSPQGFNDPFDSGSQIVLTEELIQRAIPIFESHNLSLPMDPNLLSKIENKDGKYELSDFFSKDEIKGKLFKEIANKHGVCSLSEKKDNILMWSHYANCHKGFCVEIDVEILAGFIIEKLKNYNRMMMLDKVVYGLDYPFINDLLNFENETLKPIFRKFSDWEYEAEWRLLYINHPNENVRFPEGIISAIYFGVECPKRHIKKTWELLKDRNIKPKFYQAEKSLSQFALKFRELKECR